MRATSRPGFAGFFRQCLLELRKVVWPRREAVARNTRTLVVALVTLLALLGAVEAAVGKVAGVVLH